MPRGNGVVARSRDIIYEQMREFGYRRLEERFEATRRYNERGLVDQMAHAGVPLLHDYCYVELRPCDEFRRILEGRLSRPLIPLVARIRTDLDRFSAIEIVSLFLHGYMSIDRSVAAYMPNWLPAEPPDYSFDSASPAVSAWLNDQSFYAGVDAQAHLYMSYSRIAWYRSIRRLLLRWRLRRTYRRQATPQTQS
jgi:hypothetical protein